MRLSDRHRKIIVEMEADGYVWLSHLSVNAQMRFRNKTRNGFKGYVKIEGLTFLTQRVAEAMVSGVAKEKGEKRPTYRQQLAIMEGLLVQLEEELYRARGVGKRHEVMKFKADDDNS